MTPAMMALAIVDGTLTMLERLFPLITQMVQSGEITVEQQAALKARVDALRTPESFQGPEWQATPGSSVP